MATALSGAQTASAAVKKLSPKEIDERCELLRGHEQEAEAIRLELKEQVQAFGFNPPRAKASTKRIETEKHQLTVSQSTETNVIEERVERIRTAVTPDLFNRIFVAKTKYSVAKEAMDILAAPKLPEGAPPNLRKMFAEALDITTKSPSLRIEDKDAGR